MTDSINAIEQQGGRAGARSRIVSLARGPEWDPDRFPRDLVRDIPDALRAWKDQLIALKVAEPKLDGSESRKAKMAFLPLGAKLQPGMADDKAEVWTKAMVASLSNLPVRCILTAMRDALHKTFRFPTDLEEYLRSRAEANLEFEVACITRLRRFYEHLTGVQQPLQLEQRNDPMTREEIRQLVTTPTPFSKTLLRLGLASKAINPILLAEVRAEEGLDDNGQ
jgi:hypothetical protein